MLRLMTLVLVIALLATIAQPVLARDNTDDTAVPLYTADLDFAPDDDAISNSIRAALNLSQPNSVGLSRPSVPGSQPGGIRPDPLQPATSTPQSANLYGSSSSMEQILALSQQNYSLETRYSRGLKPLPEERFLLAIASLAQRTSKTLRSAFNSIVSFVSQYKKPVLTTSQLEKPGIDSGNMANRMPATAMPRYRAPPAELFAQPPFPRPTVSTQESSAVDDSKMNTFRSTVFDPESMSGPIIFVPTSSPPSGVGDNSTDPDKFIDAYVRNEAVETIGNPTDNVTKVDDIERQEFTGGGAILYDPGEEYAFYLPSYTWPVYRASALPLGAPKGDIEPGGPPAFYADDSSDFTEEPYQRFEAGFIGKDGDSAPFTVNRYYPRIHHVEVTSVASGDQWRLQFDVLVDPSPAYANRIAVTNNPAVAVSMWREDNTYLGSVDIGYDSGTAPDLHYQAIVPVDLLEDERVSFKIVAERNAADDSRSGYFPCDGLVCGRAFHIVETSGSPIPVSGECPEPGDPAFTDIESPVIPTDGVTIASATDIGENGLIDVLVTATATDNHTIAQVVVEVNENPVPLTMSSSTYEVTVGVIPGSTNSFLVFATDLAGNRAVWPHDGDPVYLTSTMTARLGFEYAMETEFAQKDTQTSTVDGNFPHQEMDLIVYGIGKGEIRLTRTYNSMDTNVGRFGRGWSSLLDVKLSKFDSPYKGVQVFYPDGRAVTFKDLGSGNYEPGSTWVYDRLTKDGSDFVVTRKDLMVFRFDSNGKLKTMGDLNGNVVTLTYSGGKPVKVTAAGERYINISYNGDRVSKIEAPEEKTFDYGYNSSKELLTTYVNAKGYTTTYEYHSDKRLKEITSPRGHPSTRLTYYSDGRVKTHTDGADQKLTFTYYDLPDKTGARKVTDPLGNNTWHEYDDKGRLIKLTDAEGYEQEYTYDENFNLLKKKDQLGRETDYTYDSRGNRLTEDGPLGFHREWTYNSLDQATTITEADGSLTTLSYDGNGNLLSTTNALGDTSYIDYDSYGQPVRITDFAGNDTINTFSSFGDLTESEDALGYSRSYVYDGIGRCIQRADPDGAVYDYTYDDNNNIVAIDGPEGYTERYSYDQNDNLVEETDAEGRVNQHSYDTSDRIVETIDPEGGVSTVAYNAMDIKISATDQEGWTTTVKIDPLLRKEYVKNEVTPHDMITSYTYNGVGNIISLRMPSGNKISYKFDELNRMIEQVVNDTGGSQTADSNVTTYFEYDLMNRPTEIIDPLGHITRYEYDSLGRLITETDPAGNATSYAYDSMGNVVNITDRRGGVMSMSYDDGNRLISFTDQEGNKSTCTYDPMDRRTSQVDPLEVEYRWEYDLFGRLVRQIVNYQASGPHNADTNVTNTFAYDRVGNLISQTDPLAYTTTYQYDNLNRLTAAQAPDGAFVSYQYDGVSNLVSVTDPLNRVSNFTYDGLNRVTTNTDASGNVTTFGYGKTPNPVSRIDPLGVEALFTYDDLDRLVKRTDNYATGPSGPDANVVLRVEYDAFGNILKIIDPNGNHTTYEYDNMNRPISETDALGNTSTWTYDQLGNVLTETSPRVFTTSYEYDGLNRLIQTTDPLSNIVTYQYDATGHPVLVTDPYGIQMLVVYDALGRLISQTDNYISGETPDAETNVTTSVTYDAAGNRIRITDPNGNSTLFTYDSRRRPTSRQDPSGQTTTISYDLASNILEVTDPLINGTSFQYDSMNRLIRATDVAGESTYYSYDEVGNLIDLTDREGVVNHKVYDHLYRVVAEVANYNSSLPADHETNVTQQTGYDAAGNIVSITDPLGSVSTVDYDELNRPIQLVNLLLGAVTTFSYDQAGNMLNVTDPNGHITSLEYDAINRVISATDPLGRTVSNVFDWKGDVLSATDPRGNTSTMQYDPLYRAISRTDALGYTTRFEYDAASNMLAQINANGKAITFTYDQMNRPVSITDAEGYATEMAYDVIGNVISVTNPNGETTAMEYNNLYRLIRQADSLGNATLFEYDKVGNQVLKVDPLNIATRYEYDPLYRLTVVCQNFVSGGDEVADQNVDTRYSYDATGNLLTITDPLEHITGFEYDAIGQMVAEINPLGDRWEFAYDPVGNLISRLTPNDGSGPGTAYEYYADNQLKKVTYPTGKIVEYTYDENNNLIQITEPLGTTTQSFDKLNQLTSVNDALGRMLNYNYDPVGNLIRLTYPDGSYTSYSYYADGQMASIADPMGNLTTALYDPTNNLIAIDYANGTTAAMNYDAAGRMASMVNTDSKGKDISSYAYTYDAVGNILQTVETKNRAKEANTLTRNFSYDKVYRLTSAVQNDGYTAEYSYDRAGNRVSLQTGKDMLTYTYNEANQLLSLDNGKDAISYAYDGNGNRIERSDPKHNIVQIYGYDEEDRLSSVQLSTVSKGGQASLKQQVSLASDALGRTLRRTYEMVAPSPFVQTQETVWDGAVPVADYNISHGSQTMYVRGIDDRVLEEVSSKSSSTQVTTYHQDQQNSVVARTNKQGNVVERTSYDEFGRMRPVKDFDNPGSPAGSGNEPVTTMSYTGQPYDPWTNMYHFFARSYDPEAGQWTTRDPVRGSILAPVTLHRYAFTGNNPIRYTDKFGYGFFSSLWKAIKKVAKFVTKVVKAVVKYVVKPILNVVGKVLSFLGKGVISLLDLVTGGAASAFFEKVQNIVDSVKSAIADVARRVVREVISVLGEIANAIRHAVSAVKAAVIALGKLVSATARAIGKVMLQVLAAARGFLKAVVQVAKAVERAMKMVVELAVSLAPTIARALKRMAHQVISGVVQVARLFWGAVKKVASAALEAMGKVFMGVLNLMAAAGKFIEGAGLGVLRMALAPLEFIGNVFLEIVDVVVDIATKSLEVIKGDLRIGDFIGGFGDRCMAALDKVKSLGLKALSDIKGGAGEVADAWKQMVKEGSAAVKSIGQAISGLKEYINNVNSMFEDALRTIILDTLTGLALEGLEALTQIARQTFRYAVTNFYDIMDTIHDLAITTANVAKSVVNGITRTTQAVVGGIRGMVQEANKGIQLVREHLGRALDDVARAMVKVFYNLITDPHNVLTPVAVLTAMAAVFIARGGLGIALRQYLAIETEPWVDILPSVGPLRNLKERFKEEQSIPEREMKVLLHDMFQDFTTFGRIAGVPATAGAG